MSKYAKIYFLFFLALGIGVRSQAQESSVVPNATTSPSKNRGAGLPNLHFEREYDGIDISKYAGFWEKWHLVTVRYRKDNNEQRFVYANEIAFKAMHNGAKAYPEGSMFGKIAFKAAEDRAFPNSLEPNGVERIQLMKKEAAKYPESNGWGYALYTSSNGVDYSNIKSTVASCHACHKIVPDRDYVFSHTAFAKSWNSQAGDSFASKFTDKTFADLDAKLKKAMTSTGALMPSETHIKVLEMPLFDGSVNESISPVIEYARRDQLAYLLADEKNGYFIAAVPSLMSSTACSDEVKLARVKSIHLAHNRGQSRRVIARGKACAEKVTWDPAGPRRPH